MGRPFATITRVGQRMKQLDYSAHDLSRVTGIYARTLTEILAGRLTPQDYQLSALADALECDPEELLEPDL